MTVRPEEFREVFGSFPAPVAIVTALGADGRPYGLTCSAFFALSMRPPLLGICLDRRSRTLPVILATGGFAVNFLADEGCRTALAFAGKADRKFEGVAWRPGTKGAPVLTEAAVAYAGCTLERSYETGDHRLLVGRMRETEVFPREAALYHRGTFGSWTTRTPLQMTARTASG